MHLLKQQIIQYITNLLDDGIEMAELAVKNARESRNNETKSTAGDKHETGRAMSQIELDNAEKQLGHAVQVKNLFRQIDFVKTVESIQQGCLVNTSQGQYFFSVGLGKLMIDEKMIYAISPQSPIGQVLIGKKTGEVAEFQGKNFEVLEVN